MKQLNWNSFTTIQEIEFFFPPLSLTCPWPSIFFQAQVVSADEQEEDNVAAYTYMTLAVAFDLHWH